MRALDALIEHDVLGEQARWQRYMAEMLWVIATGRKVNSDTPLFTRQMDDIYRPPWGRANKAETGEAIIDHLLGR